MTHKIDGSKIAIVGGAGFIGHNLAVKLAAQGGHVEVIDSLQVNNLLAYVPKIPNLENCDLYLGIIHERLELLREKGIPLHIQDARDYSGLTQTLNQIKPNVLVHLAAVAHAGRSNKDPYSTFDHSLRTLENALDWSRGNVEQFIFLSSSMVYGNFLAEEVDEEHPLNPIGIYGALKVAGEKIVIAYQQVFDLPYTIIRPSALYGLRCVSRRVGQVFIENALNGAKLHVNGDGREKLDFTYVEDLTEGICLSIRNRAAHNQIFHMTYGCSRSILDLLGVIRVHFPDVQTAFEERDRLMPVRGTLSIKKAKHLLGYSPKYPIEEGFKKYIAWYREHLQRDQPKDVRFAR